MSQHHKAAGWASVSKSHRARLARSAVLPCLHCGGPIDTKLDKWDVAHRVDLAEGGDARDVGAAHAYCNRAAGGARGAAAVHAARRAASRVRAW